MASPISEQCRSCLTTLKCIASALSGSQSSRISADQVTEELDRLSLWIGNIGGLHRPESPLSLESRLQEAEDVFSHICELLANLNDVASELLQIASGKRPGEVAPASPIAGGDEDQEADEISEEDELLQEVGACIARLFRVSSLIRQAAPRDLFAKALTKNRFSFNDQFDIGHVGEKFPKLSSDGTYWLRKRLGSAITQRRHYLKYIHDHRDKLEGASTLHEPPMAPEIQPSSIQQLRTTLPQGDSTSRPSTYITKATTLAPGRITPQILTTEGDPDSDNDAQSYTTISRSVDGDMESSTSSRIPKLEDLQLRNRPEFECPFCHRMKKFKSERLWRKHVFNDLRSYLCTFPNCSTAGKMFGNINDWWQHEMQNHRISYFCRLCTSTSFFEESKFLAHARRQHAELLEDGDEHALLKISQKPLDQIPAEDCPCCSEWVDRLRARELPSYDSRGNTPDIAVPPTLFKRHLASHLEQLALFAIPIESPGGNDDMASDVAIEEASSRSNLSIATFRSAERTSQGDDNYHGSDDDLEAGAEPDLGHVETTSTLLTERDLYLTRKTLKNWWRLTTFSRKPPLSDGSEFNDVIELHQHLLKAYMKGGGNQAEDSVGYERREWWLAMKLAKKWRRTTQENHERRKKITFAYPFIYRSLLTETEVAFCARLEERFDVEISCSETADRKTDKLDLTISGGSGGVDLACQEIHALNMQYIAMRNATTGSRPASPISNHSDDDPSLVRSIPISTGGRLLIHSKGFAKEDFCGFQRIPLHAAWITLKVSQDFWLIFVHPESYPTYLVFETAHHQRALIESSREGRLTIQGAEDVVHFAAQYVREEERVSPQVPSTKKTVLHVSGEEYAFLRKSVAFAQILASFDIVCIYYPHSAPLTLPRKVVFLGPHFENTVKAANDAEELLNSSGLESRNGLMLRFQTGLYHAIKYQNLITPLATRRAVDCSFMSESSPTSHMMVQFYGPNRDVQNARYEAMTIVDLQCKQTVREEWPEMISELDHDYDANLLLPFFQSPLGPFKPFKAEAIKDQDVPQPDGLRFGCDDQVDLMGRVGEVDFYVGIVLDLEMGKVNSGKVPGRLVKFIRWLDSDEVAALQALLNPNSGTTPTSEGKNRHLNLDEDPQVDEKSFDQSDDDEFSIVELTDPRSSRNSSELLLARAHRTYHSGKKSHLDLVPGRNVQVSESSPNGTVRPGYYYGYYEVSYGHEEVKEQGYLPRDAVTIPFQVIHDSWYDMGSFLFYCPGCLLSQIRKEGSWCPDCNLETSERVTADLWHLDDDIITVIQARKEPQYLWLGVYDDPSGYVTYVTFHRDWVRSFSDLKPADPRYRLLPEPLFVCAHQEYIAEDEMELGFDQGQGITVSHCFEDGSQKRYFGHYAQSQKLRKGSFPAHGVTIPFKAIVVPPKSDAQLGYPKIQDRIWQCGACDNLVIDHTNSTCSICGHQRGVPLQDGLSLFEGQVVTVTQASSKQGLWHGYYLHKSGNKTLVSFGRNRVSRILEHGDAVGTLEEAVDAPSPQHEHQAEIADVRESDKAELSIS